MFLHRKLKEDKEEIEEQRRLRQEEEERSLVTVSFFKKMCSEKNKWFIQSCMSNAQGCCLISYRKRGALKIFGVIQNWRDTAKEKHLL